MHQKNHGFHQIGDKEKAPCFSDLKTAFSPDFFQEFQYQKESTLPTHQRSSARPHLSIKIPSFSSNSWNQNGPFPQNHPTNETPLSIPHKRPMMSENYSFSRSPTVSRINQNPEALVTATVKKKESVLSSDTSHQDSLCFPSFPMCLATKRISLRFIHHSYPASVFRIQLKLKLFVLLFVTSMYIFTLTHLWSLLFHFLYTLAFFALLVILLFLALHRFPKIRVFLEKTLCSKLSCLTTPSHHHPEVVWSIGTKPKLERRPSSGSWVQVYSNGDVYEGEFHKGKCSGSGVYYYHMSGRYEGDWIDEKYDGYGIETWAKGSRYSGQYRQGIRHGVGVYRSYTGDIYSGEWSSGQCHGYGIHSCEDGSSYVGQFKWGAKHGLGHYHFRNGDSYAGEYFADKMHGFGVYHFGNGHRYEGAWHEGRREGFGTYTFRNGEIQSGYWQNGVLNAASPSASTPRSSIDVEHKKVLHAVQEARRASKEAVELANIDARVKRVVTAANKAATAARVSAVKAVQNQMHENVIDYHVPSLVA